ncbi:MAG: glycosyltransferase family 2 protein [Candidatus Omnitrophica bacterium]|nr:glycosyltransferase family 2 protein [Candidatus Omnitrophota bacterium]
MPAAPLVSVILPTWNRRSFLEKAVESVRLQTFPHWELWVIDDGSTDGTGGLFPAADPRIQYVYQANAGVAAARNAGIRRARGEWIAFLDSDDRWLPGKLERQMKFHENHPHRISQTDEIWIRNGKRVNAMKKHEKKGGPIFESCLKLCLISPSCALLSKKLIDETGLFDESFEVCEDYEYWLRVTARHPVGLVDEKLVVKHGGHADQLSRRHWGMDRFRIRALRKIIDSGALTPAQKEAASNELEVKCRIYARGCLKRDRPGEAREYAIFPA